MKFSKSVLVFLVVSTTLSVFYYGLKRTDGNVYQSIMFTTYFLAIKIGLIGPTTEMALDQYDSNQQQLVVKNRVLPSYYPYISASDNCYYSPSRLYMGKTEMPRFVPEYSHSVKSVNEIRAGGRLSDTAFWFALLYLLKHHTAGFQSINPIPRPPHVESARNLLFGEPKPDPFSCRRLSVFDSQQSENKDQFVMSKQEALNLLDNTYTGSKIISETEKVSDWQMAKKVYHLNGLGVNPEKYGMSKAEVNAIRNDGLKYTMNGGKLPPIELVRAGQNRIYDICYNDTVARKENGIFGEQDQHCSFYYNTETRHIIYFNNIDGDLIMGEKFRKNYFNNSLIKNNINIKEN